MNGQSTVLQDEAEWEKNKASIGGGVIFFDYGNYSGIYPDSDSDCGNCKDNSAAYGDTYATWAVKLHEDKISPKMNKKSRNVDNLHTEFEVQVSLRDRFGQDVAGEDLLFVPQSDGSDDSYLVDADGINEGTPLEAVSTSKGKAKFEFALVGVFKEKYTVSFYALGYEEMGAITFDARINECEDDEYEENYPPGVPLYTVCREPSFVSQTDDMKIASWVFGVIAGLGMLAAIASIPVVIIFRTRKVINYSSPEFSIIILVGVLIGYAAVIPFIVTPSDGACIMQPILILLAFGLCLTPLVVRTYHVWCLFSNKSFKVLRITTLQLLVPVAVIIALEVAIIILWMAWSTPQWHWSYDDDTDDTRTKACTSEYTNVMVAIACGFNGLLLLSALFLAFKTRQVVEGFGEAKVIAIIIYAITFAAVLLVPLVFLSDDLTFQTILICVGILFCSTATFVCLFGHKFYVLATGADRQEGYGSTFKANSTRAPAPSKPKETTSRGENVRGTRSFSETDVSSSMG
eukprot:TRINITY_DN355_c0_g3_i1.p1 TRINITY_DN355_c0_g3~~TRINITY_DN355_c0_g3_i1.p1  ORF type:complete len:517 (+),score=139.75 TRINITY_DN355_c0_g3_i1:1422-2972(+)